MSKVHPQATAAKTSSKQEVFTIWMKSLVLNGFGCTVFDSKGQVAYRVDNYNHKCSSQVYLMDTTGKLLFTILKKRFSFFSCWEGYRSKNSHEVNKGSPGFQVRQRFRVLRGNSVMFKVVVGNQPLEYKIESWSCNPSCRILDNSGGLVAEVKRKSSISGVDLGEDVMAIMVEPYTDHSLIMALVVVVGLIHHKL